MLQEEPRRRWKNWNVSNKEKSGEVKWCCLAFETYWNFSFPSGSCLWLECFETKVCHTLSHSGGSLSEERENKITLASHQWHISTLLANFSIMKRFAERQREDVFVTVVHFCHSLQLWGSVCFAQEYPELKHAGTINKHRIAARPMGIERKVK